MRTGFARKVAAALLTGAVAASLVGCASGTDNASGGDVELSFWTFLDPNSPDDPRGAALKDIVDSYNAQSDGVTVTVRSINYAKIDAEVIKATASNSGPDILNVYSNQLPTHVAAGTVQPMTDYVEPYLEELGDEYLFPIDGATFDGDVMALPWETRAWLLWYRADLLEQAGLEVPATLDELGTTAAALGEATGTTGLGIGFSNAGLGADFMEKFIPFTWGNGGEVLEDGAVAFDDAAGEKTMDYFVKLHDEGAFGDEVLSMGADDIVNGVKAGTIAMAIEGSYRVGAARSGEGIGENLQTAPIPSTVAGEPLETPVAGQTLTIGSTTKNADAAWDFIKYYSSAESQEKFAAAGVLPVLASVYDSPAVQALPNATELATWRDYVLEHGRPNPVSENFSELSDALVTQAQKVVFQGADAGDALADVAAKFGK